MDKLDQVEKLIGIKFGKSTSHNYKKAVQIANQFSDFMPLSEKNESNCIWIDLQEFREKYKQIESLWYIIRGWKSSELYLEGTLADYNDLRLLFWAMECATAYSSAIVQDDHCKFSMEEAGWGCKKLKEIFLGRPGWQFYYRNRKFWFQFGHFETPTRWKVDKDDIRKALSREANFKKLFVCPVFDFEKANEIIDSLPDEIDLESSDSWEIIYQENLQHQSIEKKPICIAPKNIENHSRDGLSASISFNLDSDAEKEKSPKIRFIPDVCFEDIGGIDDILQIIREIIELPMKQPRLFDHLKIEPHKGILLHGPAGCGKTLIAKAIANEVKAHFIPVKGPELLSKWHGQSEQNLRSIFEEARELQPSIIFFDEIDSVAQRRSDEENLRLDARFVNQLLTLMDGIEDFGNVCVMASTNRQELLDEALVRPGRFDYSIRIEKPNLEGCEKIFRIHSRDMPLSDDFNLSEFAKKLEGLSGAQIAFIAREGAYNCLRRSTDLKQLIEEENEQSIDYKSLIITEIDFLKALKKVQNA